jgi:hypothetical protein
MFPKPRNRTKRKGLVRVLSDEQRRRIEAIVDGLVQLLDEYEGDTDFEPSTNATNGSAGDVTDHYVASGMLDECETGGDREEEIDEPEFASTPDEDGGRAASTHDGEPSLGWTDMEGRSGRFTSKGGKSWTTASRSTTAGKKTGTWNRATTALATWRRLCRSPRPACIRLRQCCASCGSRRPPVD